MTKACSPMARCVWRTAKFRIAISLVCNRRFRIMSRLDCSNICGTSLATLRVLGLSLFLLLPLLVYGIARSLGAGALLSFAATASLCLLGIPIRFLRATRRLAGDCCLPALPCFFLYCSALTRRKWLAIPAGIFTAFSLFLRHDQAIYTSVAICALMIALHFCADDAARKYL